MIDHFRDYWSNLFNAAPGTRIQHNACASRSDYETMRVQLEHTEKALLGAEIEMGCLRGQIEELERKLDTAKAKADTYSTMYAELRGRALPVSLLLVEGQAAQAMAINAGLWDLVRPEDAA